MSLIPPRAMQNADGIDRACPGWSGWPPPTRYGRLAIFLALLAALAGAPANGASPDRPAEATFAELVPGLPSDSAAVVPSDSGAIAQRDVMDVLDRLLHGDRIEPEMNLQFGRGIAWTILPTATYNPVFGFAVGASISGAGRRGDHPESRVSNLSIGGNYSTTGQVQAYLRGDVFSSNASYLLKGDLRYMDTNRSTWGLGPEAKGQESYPMEYAQNRTYLTLYRKISPAVYGGVGYHFDEYYDIRDERAESGETTPFTTYSGGGVDRTIASGYSVNLLGDTRDNPVNPSSGFYISANLRNYPKGLGSDNNWQEMLAEFRSYPHLPSRSPNTLAFWFYTWFTFGQPPYLSLPASGGDTNGRGGRGYLQGRIRGRNQIYFEAEYRVQLTRDGLLGAVAFLNLTGTTLPDEQTFGRTDKGVGGRVKFNKRSNTNLSVDAAWGEHSSVKWFFGLGEVF